jgi:hypothetical protein
MHDPAWQRREAGKNKLRPPPQAYRGSRKKFTIAPVWSGLDCKSTIACDLLLVPLSGHLLKKGPAVKGAAPLSHNWRELHAGAGEVLVKSIDGVGLLDRDLFISRRSIS